MKETKVKGGEAVLTQALVGGGGSGEATGEGECCVWTWRGQCAAYSQQAKSISGVPYRLDGGCQPEAARKGVRQHGREPRVVLCCHQAVLEHAQHLMGPQPGDGVAGRALHWRGAHDALQRTHTRTTPPVTTWR